LIKIKIALHVIPDLIRNLVFYYLRYGVKLEILKQVQDGKIGRSDGKIRRKDLKDLSPLSEILGQDPFTMTNNVGYTSKKNGY